MREPIFSKQLGCMVNMIIEGVCFEEYCRKHHLTWLLPQLRVIDKAYRTKLFLKEEIITFLSLPADEHKAFTEEMENFSERITHLNCPMTAITSRRVIH